MKPDEILDVLDAQSATTWPQFHGIATNEYYATVDDVLLTSDSFQHVVSPSFLTGDAERDRFAVLPSASPTYRSLAEAIAFRDATRFVPGASNLDWRRWARNPV